MIKLATRPHLKTN